jgi:hypothetical protein
MHGIFRIIPVDHFKKASVNLFPDIFPLYGSL